MRPSLAGDYQHVLELGLVAPNGSALPDEAAEPEVQFAVAQAAMALGRIDQAGAVAEATTGFRQALIRAELLVASDTDQPHVAAQYESAWELAATEEEKVAFWLSASTCGIDPLPGIDELEARTDEVPALVAAQVEPRPWSPSGCRRPATTT